MDKIIGDAIHGDIKAKLFNDPLLQKGVINKCLCFNGVDQYASLGNLRDQCLGNPVFCHDGFTLAAWIKSGAKYPFPKETYYISSGGQTRTSMGVALYRKPGGYGVTVRLNGKMWKSQGFAPVIEDVWTHVAFTWHPQGKLVTYVNGQMKTSVSRSCGVTSNYMYHREFTIGAPNNNYCNDVYFGQFCIMTLMYTRKTKGLILSKNYS